MAIKKTPFLIEACNVFASWFQPGYPEQTGHTFRPDNSLFPKRLTGMEGIDFNATNFSLQTKIKKQVVNYKKQRYFFE